LLFGLSAGSGLLGIHPQHVDELVAYWNDKKVALKHDCNFVLLPPIQFLLMYECVANYLAIILILL